MGFIAQNAVPHIVVMGHLHFVEQDNVFQLRGIAYHGPFSHDGIAAHKRTVADFSILVYDKRPVQAGRGGYFGAFGNPDMLSPFLINFFRKALAQADDKIMDFRKRFPWIGQSLQQSGGDCLL